MEDLVDEIFGVARDAHLLLDDHLRLLEAVGPNAELLVDVLKRRHRYLAILGLQLPALGGVDASVIEDDGS
jgi:hypothetical protein